MKYHETMKCTEPISGNRFDLAILSDAERVVDGETLPADVYIAIGGSINVSLRMTPANARQFAAHLALAAECADASEAEIIDFQLP